MVVRLFVFILGLLLVSVSFVVLDSVDCWLIFGGLWIGLRFNDVVAILFF